MLRVYGLSVARPLLSLVYVTQLSERKAFSLLAASPDAAYHLAFSAA